jgi:hypothetical protein
LLVIPTRTTNANPIATHYCHYYFLLQLVLLLLTTATHNTNYYTRLLLHPRLQLLLLLLRLRHVPLQVASLLPRNVLGFAAFSETTRHATMQGLLLVLPRLRLPLLPPQLLLLLLLMRLLSLMLTLIP